MVVVDTALKPFLQTSSVEIVQVLDFLGLDSYAIPKSTQTSVDENGAFRLEGRPGRHSIALHIGGSTFFGPEINLEPNETLIHNFYLEGGNQVSGMFQFMDRPEASTFQLTVIRESDGALVASTVLTPDVTGGRPKLANRDEIPEDMSDDPRHGAFKVSKLAPDIYTLRFTMLPLLPGVPEEIHWDHPVDLRNGDVDVGTHFAHFDDFEAEKERRNQMARDMMDRGLLPTPK